MCVLYNQCVGGDGGKNSIRWPPKSFLFYNLVNNKNTIWWCKDSWNSAPTCQQESLLYWLTSIGLTLLCFSLAQLFETIPNLIPFNEMYYSIFYKWELFVWRMAVVPTNRTNSIKWISFLMLQVSKFFFLLFIILIYFTF